MMMYTWIGTMGVGALVVLGFFYFLPTMVALSRRHQNGVAIFALNLLLGWTFLGWVIALIWSLTVVQKQ